MHRQCDRQDLLRHVVLICVEMHPSKPTQIVIRSCRCCARRFCQICPRLQLLRSSQLCPCVEMHPSPSVPRSLPRLSHVPVDSVQSPGACQICPDEREWRPSALLQPTTFVGSVDVPTTLFFQSQPRLQLLRSSTLCPIEPLRASACVGVSAAAATD